MKLFKTKIIFIIIIFVFLATSGLSCKLFPTNQPPANLTASTELSYWGIWDEPDDLAEIIGDFTDLHPNIKITYKKFRLSEYEQKLLEAWAADKGPDIYSIPAAWLKKYQPFITPQPEKINLAFKEIKSTLGRDEEITTVKSVPALRPSDVKSQFADAVNKDIVIENKIYGIPFYIDTLALYYNQDLLDSAGVATPPKNWDELTEAVKKITVINQKNQIITSGAALGTAGNISNSADIVSLLMMQVGSTMANEQGRAVFDQPSGQEKSIPSLAALRFYTDFANPLKEVYSWNNSQANSLDAFISGKLAMMFGYNYHLQAIKGRSPKLAFGVSQMPQLAGAIKSINYTNYWVETVSHKTKNPEIAWGFLNFASSSSEIQKYLAKTKRPTALRSLITAQLDDPEIAPFASQVLTAQRWYRGQDEPKMQEIFKDLIDNFADSAKPEALLRQTAEKINQTM